MSDQIYAKEFKSNQIISALKDSYSYQHASKLKLQETISQSKLDKVAEALGGPEETIKTLDENALLLVATGVQPELLASSVREMIK